MKEILYKAIVFYAFDNIVMKIIGYPVDSVFTNESEISYHLLQIDALGTIRRSKLDVEIRDDSEDETFHYYTLDREAAINWCLEKQKEEVEQRKQIVEDLKTELRKAKKDLEETAKEKIRFYGDI